MEFNLYNHQNKQISLSGLKEIARSVWCAEQKRNTKINVIFVSNDHICELNRQYLGKNNPTDVIAFPLSDDDDMFEGEIYISVDQVFINSEVFGVTPGEELRRVLVHGLLHFLGYEDKTPGDKKKMTERENFFLNEM